MYDCTERVIVKKNKLQKEWHNATKPLVSARPESMTLRLGILMFY
jgi:hypothetical protein